MFFSTVFAIFFTFFPITRINDRIMNPVQSAIDSHNSAPMQEAAYGPDKMHNSYTGRLSYDSPAVHDTARSEAAKAMQVPAGRVQSPSPKAGWGTSDLPAALR